MSLGIAEARDLKRIADALERIASKMAGPKERFQRYIRNRSQTDWSRDKEAFAGAAAEDNR